MSEIRTTRSAAKPAPHRAWAHRLARDWRHLQWFKLLGIVVFMVLFFSVYFHLLHNPVHPVTLMPMTLVDQWIVFEPAAFWVYASLWFYVGIAPGFLPSLRALLEYGAWAAALCATGLLCFYLWPTAVPSQAYQLAPALAQHPGFTLMRGLDSANNACPSLHVATAMFSALWIRHLLAAARAPRWLHAVNGSWLLLIAWSTVAVQQHVALDVLAGAALGLAFGLTSLRWGAAARRAAAGTAAAAMIGSTSTSTATIRERHRRG